MTTQGRRLGGIIGRFVAGLYSVPEGVGYASQAGIDPMLGIHAGMCPWPWRPRPRGRCCS